VVSPQQALEVLLGLTRSLADGRSLEASLELVTRAALALLDVADHGSVRLLDESRARLLSGARAGVGLEQAPLDFRPGEGLAGWVVENRLAARVPDVQTDDRFVRRPEQGFPVRSILAVPLWSNAAVIGVLAISSAERDAFDEQHELLASLLANCAVPAIERARLERLAVTDPHTSAFNRRYLAPRLLEEMSRSGRTGSALSLLMMDLDHFKRVNDEHGHASGDLVLREFADRVREATRRQDVLVRWGGEEFMLLMPDTSLDTARSVAERIRQQTSTMPFHADDGTEIAQTVSIGLATWDGSEDPESLEARADAAMYDAKRSGRNSVMPAG
jgi:diguanylate cyclase (GGDEF)-like protein